MSCRLLWFPLSRLVPLNERSARAFLLELQAARENAIKDAEAFDGIIHVIERLGILLSGKVAALGQFGPHLKALAGISPLANVMPREHHTPFDLLYGMVTQARNDALHIGAFARHLTTHAIELALVLEDALRIKMNMNNTVSDFMIRNPVCAHLWQPVSFVRQIMLTNSFSYLPVQDEDGKWRLVVDLEVARYLQTHSNRNVGLATPLERAKAEGMPLPEAKKACVTNSVKEALERLNDEKSKGQPLLVFRNDTCNELEGILTSFDLL